MKKYRVQDREAGNRIEDYNSRKEAEKALVKFEEDDKQEGTFEKDFYEIVEIETESKHTPGPWYSRKGSSPHYQGQIYGEDGKTIAISYNDEEGKNCSLISATPELLAELKNIVASLHEAVSMTSEEKHFNARWKRELIDARKAISKAEGGQ